MARYAIPVERLIEEFARFPGIGKKSAERMVFHLLTEPKERIDNLSHALMELKDKVGFCKKCFNYTDEELCNICSNPNRDESVICVVEMPKDLMAIEDTGGYRGLYHVLHGTISPIAGIYPEHLKINELMKRIEKKEVKEIILATNPSSDGDATAAFLSGKIRDKNIKLTRIAHGVPVGSNLEFYDSMTILMALDNRIEM